METNFEIIDAHSHIYPPMLAKKAKQNTKIGTQDSGADGTLSSQLNVMRQIGISKSIVLHVAGRPETMHRVNEFAIQAMCDELIAFGSVHPFAEDVHAELDRLYKKGIRGIKFHNTLQKFNLEDPRCFDIYRHIGELGLATLIHGGGSMRGTDFWVFPENLEKVLHYFQGAPVILAHMGGTKPGEKQFEVLKDLPVYTDTALAASRLTREEFEEAVLRLGAEKILFGSDLPWESPRVGIELIRNTSLTDREKALIFSGNAKALYGI